jgi:hypothetical protein
MPSLHIAWALWCGTAIVLCAKRVWVRILGALHPVGTLMVIVGTANHFIIDAVGGAAVLTLGFAVQYLLSGHGAFVPPDDAGDFGMPDPTYPGERPRHEQTPADAGQA